MQVRLNSVTSRLCLNFMYFLLSSVLVFLFVVLKLVFFMVILFFTWWNGTQVTKVARMLAAKPAASEDGLNSYVVMALLDGGLLRRHKTWLKVLHLFLFFKYTQWLLCDVVKKLEKGFGLDGVRYF